MKDIYQAFEFDRVKKILESYVKGEYALKQIRNLEMFSNKDELIDELNYLDQMINYTLKYRSLTLNPHNDILPYLKSLNKDGVGNIEFFYQV